MPKKKDVAKAGEHVALRNRVKELRVVKASSLIANEKNWRVHPSTQAVALRKMVDRVGFVSPILAVETKDGLKIVDGHLRAGITEDEMVPVVILDLTPAEEAEVLASLDPLNSMAKTDGAVFDRLVQSLSDAGQDLMEDVLFTSPVWGFAFEMEDESPPEKLEDALSRHREKVYPVSLQFTMSQKAVFDQAVELSKQKPEEFVVELAKSTLGGKSVPLQRNRKDSAKQQAEA